MGFVYLCCKRIFENCISQVPAPQRERAVCEAAAKLNRKPTKKTKKRGKGNAGYFGHCMWMLLKSYVIRLNSHYHRGWSSSQENGLWFFFAYFGRLSKVDQLQDNIIFEAACFRTENKNVREQPGEMQVFNRTHSPKLKQMRKIMDNTCTKCVPRPLRLPAKLPRNFLTGDAARVDYVNF